MEVTSRVSYCSWLEQHTRRALRCCRCLGRPQSVRFMLGAVFDPSMEGDLDFALLRANSPCITFVKGRQTRENGTEAKISGTLNSIWPRPVRETISEKQ